MHVSGEVAEGYEGVRDAFEQAHADDPGGAQLCVYRDGEPVIDLWVGSDMGSGRQETGDTLHVLMSSTKGVLAVVAGMLIDRGLLDPEAPVAEYWPEYAAAGKERTTVAHLLSHTAGLPAFRAKSAIRAADLDDWERCVRALAEAEPYWEPGTATSYHAVTYGFLVGEVVRRVTGRSAGQYLAENISRPLGMDLFLGLPSERARDVALQAARTGLDYDADAALPAPTDPALIEVAEAWFGSRFLDGYLTSPVGRACELGAVNGIGSARSLARIYAATLGPVDGIRLLSANALARAIHPRNTGVPLWAPYATVPFARAEPYGLGFTLVHPLGAKGGAPVFGHSGAGGIEAFASVELGVAVGYTTSSMHMRLDSPDPRLGYLEALVEAGLA